MNKSQQRLLCTFINRSESIIKHENEGLIYLPEFLLEYEKELEKQLFDKPFAHFRDCLSPLIKMKDGEWNPEYAIKYLTELREKGYVDNQQYNLW